MEAQGKPPCAQLEVTERCEVCEFAYARSAMEVLAAHFSLVEMPTNFEPPHVRTFILAERRKRGLPL